MNKAVQCVASVKYTFKAQNMYVINRITSIRFLLPFQKRARESHMALARFARTTDLPLYNQPSDTDLYHDNKRRCVCHKPCS